MGYERPNSDFRKTVDDLINKYGTKDGKKNLPDCDPKVAIQRLKDEIKKQEKYKLHDEPEVYDERAAFGRSIRYFKSIADDRSEQLRNFNDPSFFSATRFSLYIHMEAYRSTIKDLEMFCRSAPYPLSTAIETLTRIIYTLDDELRIRPTSKDYEDEITQACRRINLTVKIEILKYLTNQVGLVIKDSTKRNLTNPRY